MSTQQDLYAAGSKNRPPMLNKENYVPWSSRLLWYAKNREVPVNETFHEQTDDELTEKELKQVEANDQAIQTVLLGLPEDIYVAVASLCRFALKEEAGIQLTQEEFDFMADAGAYEEIERVNANCTLKDNLQQASTSGTQADKAPVYDSDESANVEQDGGTVDQHPATVEETCAYFESLYNNLAIEVEKVNTVNRKLRETNADLTTELARYKNQENCVEISQEKYDKLERCLQKSTYQEKCLTKKMNALHLSFGKQITTLKEEISNLNKQLLKEKSTVSSLLEEKKELKSNFKIREDELLDK
ncbi:hypothetical protein Tco_0339208 [Tanacetum coccineum]